ncbi:hypothetical protein ACOME3_004019 [Neoechinorhynchus agilis]
MKRDKQPSITDSGSNPTSQFLLEGSLSDEIPQQLTSSFKTQREYLALPVKRWPYILTIKSNPIMPKDVIYNQSVAPWTRSFHNDGVKRIDRITYFGGILRVYLTDSIWLSNLKDFVKSKLPRDVFSVEEITQRVQFMANGLQPNLAAEDKVEFEKLFNRWWKDPGKLGMTSVKKCTVPLIVLRFDSHRNREAIKMTIFFLTATFATNGDTGFNIAPIRIPRNVFTVLRQVILLKIAQTSQSKDVSIAMDNTLYFTKDVLNSRSIGIGLKTGSPLLKKAIAPGGDRLSQQTRSQCLFIEQPPFQKITILKSSDSKDSHRLPPSQLVTMEILEERLEESCNKLLTVMQARFTEAIVAFERKLSTLIGNLVNLPDLISSSLPSQRGAKLKRANATEKNSHWAKKLNVDSSINHSDIEDVVMEVEETDSEYVNRIINTQSSLINNGTAALISDEVARI